MRVTHVMLYLIHGNQHSQHPKNYENQKLGNKIEDDTEDSTVQVLKHRNRVDKQKSLKKNKRKGVNQELIVTQCESYILLLKNLSHQKKMANQAAR